MSRRGGSAALKESSGLVPLLWDHRASSVYWKLRIDPVDPGRDRAHDALTLECELQSIPNTSSYDIVKDSLGNWTEFESRVSRKVRTGSTKETLASPWSATSRRKVSFVSTEPDPNESLPAQISDPRTDPIPTRTRRLLEGWRVDHDVHVERGSAMRSPATTQYVKLVEPDGSNLVSALHTLYTS